MKRKIIDGNTAVAKASYKLSDISFIYPITPSSAMAETCDEMASKDEKNIFGNTVSVTEMQSEGGAIGALHGASLTGSVATTFTSSQGLLLMLPNMYKIAGEMLPATIHVASRSIATHALNIFCDHSDVMSARQTGFAMLCSSSVQEAHDFAVASHIASIESQIPFLHFFDGFRTSHEVKDILTFEDKELKNIYPFEKLNEFKQNALSPNKPFQTGTNEGTDVFFQGRERANANYKNLPRVLQNVFDRMQKISGREHYAFEYIGSKNAKNIVVVMGSGYYALKNYVENCNQKIGVLKVNLYRPFATELFFKALPKSVEKITVLDRTKEHGSVGEPLYLDICSAVLEFEKQIKVIGGRYGLGGKEFDETMCKAVFDNMQQEKYKNHFTVGIVDDITNTSLEIDDYQSAETSYNTVFWGMGSDGTVSCAKNITKVIGSLNKHVQAYFLYDSKKSGSLTRSYLRFDDDEIEKPYLPNAMDCVVITNLSYLRKYDFYTSLKQGAKLLVNCRAKNTEQFENLLSDNAKKFLSKKQIEIFTIDANKIASSNNIKGKISAIMQMAYFKITNMIDYEKAKEMSKQSLQKSLSKKGTKIIEDNCNAIEVVEAEITKIEANNNWLNIDCNNQLNNDYVNKVLSIQGDDLKVSEVKEFGRTELSTSKFEKRDISDNLPVWDNEKCVQCGKCAFVCPHAVIRPKLLDDKQIENSPNTFKYSKSFVYKNKNYVLEISPKDCTGCGLCENACPVKSKAIKLIDKTECMSENLENFDFSSTLQGEIPSQSNTPFQAQFLPPYFEYSGACAGCGETPYLKLLTQLFGNRLVMANATGCSSIYGGSQPTCPYCTDQDGKGPAWANSLFEDNAEFGYGMIKSINSKRENFANYIEQNLNNFDMETKKMLKEWLEHKDNIQISNNIYTTLKNNKKIADNIHEQYLYDNLDCLTKKSMWIVGGDGWAYDIGFGGLDHVLASGENLNILVLDTELYSNTGGQMSKSSPMGTNAKFCAKGKQNAKKQLALMAMTYKNVYVAQVCLGADLNQTLKAFKEAEIHKGVSLIIAYCPCINHGIDMNKNIDHQITAVNSGYWPLFRYNPALTTPLVIDSKKPTANVIEHLKTQRRFAYFIENNSEQAVLDKLEKNYTDFYNLLETIANNKK